MPKHTLDTVRTTICQLRDQETVYKSEVDLLKHAFSNAFEADWRVVKDSKHLSVDHDKRIEVDSELYFAAPYEVRHWYGKKFSAFLENMPSTEFKDATVSHRNRWRPLFLALQELIGRQVKGRKPKVKKVVATRTQLRAVCPCCFGDYAITKDGRVVAHGYTLDYGFQNGSCHGTGEKHFGTVEGKECAEGIIKALRSNAALCIERAGKARRGEILPRDSNTHERIENPTERQKEILALNLEAQERNYTSHANMIQKKVDEWTPAEPREVEVEVTE